MKKHRKYFLLLPLGALAIFAGATLLCLKPVNESFSSITSSSRNVPVMDRNGEPLSITYQTQWNSHDAHPLYEFPPLLKDAFLFSEDRKFYDHGGVDWKARLNAAYQNLKSRRTVRGASTMTEQVVRMINPRPRNLWSKWLEGIEAVMLEQNTSKPAIFEFYLNQIPYASNRRGVAQAARYYFNRDLDTLSAKETLALVILARAPSSYDLYKNPDRLEPSLQRLALQMKDNNKITASIYDDLQSETLTVSKSSLPADARHFARYVLLQNPTSVTRTTLDSSLQRQVQAVVDSRLKKLSQRNVHNAAAIVIDHEINEILSWVVGSTGEDTKGGEIDMVIAPRQPGSTLKPFLYAAAMEKGWTAATILNDAPIAEAVGSGLHRFRNYSNSHYGLLTVREALGNSLNIPAILAIDYVGTDKFLTKLHELGFDSLNRGSQIYDEGLALGNGEVTLLELTRAYATLARRGEYRDFHYNMNEGQYLPSRKVYSPDIASIIGNILSDPHARSLEFGRDSILNMPIRTAIKTGTSTDYRDAWTVGYNDRYTVGIWMGNVDRTPMKEVTGSTGPALVMRSIMNILNRDRDTRGLYLSPTLTEQDVCVRPAKDGQECQRRTELFVAGSTIEDAPAPRANKKSLELIRPTNGLMVAYDPRIPSDHQKFRFEIAGLHDGDRAEWVLNGKTLVTTDSGQYLWPVQRGTYKLGVTVHSAGKQPSSIAPVEFIVR